MFNSTLSVTVHIITTEISYICNTNESLLAGMLRLGKKGIPAGCTNGGCGVCKVRILAGEIKKTGPISRARVTASEEEEGYTLACRVQPISDVKLEVATLLRKPFRSVKTINTNV
ncbi:MAG TPA: 2Fe-2S iron-sulfur cluster binding domain-containing protein [Burkholderiaceae bacterium]|nr:2Fe-2S iron-sulfur cluster binding domain-containing protein [Burkholderiaceae bacterium]